MQLIAVYALCLFTLAAGGQRRPKPRSAAQLQLDLTSSSNVSGVRRSSQAAHGVPHPKLELVASQRKESPDPRKAILFCQLPNVMTLLRLWSHEVKRKDPPAAANSTSAEGAPPTYQFEEDPCVWGFTKLFWAIFLTGLSLVSICVCVPILLEITRRRAPGQPLILFGIACCQEPTMGRMAMPPPTSRLPIAVK
mmetsp:Transcript_8495/g.15845  ORF Transcript_8495/g.15845 Transcript_8495/m.15845 type:complete len:194 (+) Transcript_8495:87-668(+)